MRRTYLASLAFFLSIASTARAEDRLQEIEARFKGARKWFGMVADLPWDRQGDMLVPRTNMLGSHHVIRRDAAGQSLHVALPAVSNRAFRVELDDTSGFWARAIEIGAPPVDVQILRGMAIYPGAVAGGDLLYKVTPTHLDEYVYFRSPPSTLSRRFEIETGPAVARLREAGDMIELVDRDGTARLRISAPLARAADGGRRRGTVHVSGRVLTEEIDLAGLAAPILIDPDWTTTGSMTVAHWGDGAWRRPDDRAMVVGGCALAACPTTFAGAACSQVIANSDVWDPKSGTWTSAASLGTARYAFAHASLPNGDFLVAGGCTATGCAQTTASAERYVFADAKWIPAGALDVSRANAMAARLGNGDVLVAGGCANACTASSQRYTPSANGWSPSAALPSPRGFATATALADGRVLVAGGCTTPDCANILDDALVYDPVGNAWSPAGKMSSPRAGHTATLLGDGTVLVAGGCVDGGCATTLDTVDLWSPAMTSFSPGPKMAAPRHDHTATRLLGGPVLVAGGGNNGMTIATTEVYYPIAKQWVKPGAMLLDRAFHVAIDLAGGNVLVAGGCNPQTCLPWAEVFSPASLPGDADGGVSYDGGEPPVPPSIDAGPPGAPGSPHPALHRTGVVTCATDKQQDFTCPVSGWPLQDGDFQPNDKPIDTGAAGELRDPVTGLTWQADDGGGNYTQADAIAHCADLAPKGTWRLPSVIELVSIVNYARMNPSIDPHFQNTQPTNYWTSSAVASTQNLRWTVKFDFGEVVPLLGDTTLPARCVRDRSTMLGTTRKGGPLVAGADTVTDDRTGLEWQKRDDGTKRTWRDALQYCSSLSLGGRDDWHLPNIAEIESIVEYAGDAGDIRIDPAFENTAGDIYWSSTQNEGAPTLSWSVTFNLGVVDGVTVGGLAHVRCVRHVTKPTGGGCGCQAGPSDVAGSAPLVLVPLAILARRRRRSQ